MPKCKVGACTPQQAGQAWNSGFTAGAANAKATVTNKQVQWAERMVAMEQQIATDVARAFSSGRWREGVERTGNRGWKEAMLSKGIPRMAAGSQAGQAHYAAFRSQWDPYVTSIVNGLPPRGSFEMNRQRSNALIEQTHALKGKFKGLWKQGIGG